MTVTVQSLTDAQADAEIQRLRDAWSQGSNSLGLTPESLLSKFTFGLYDVPVEVQSSITNMGELKDLIDKWATQLRAWAEVGHRDDGSSYTWADWLSLEATYADAIRAYTGYGWGGSIYTVATNTADATATQVAHGAEAIAHPFSWPAWAWVLVLVGGAWLLRPYLAAVEGG